MSIRWNRHVRYTSVQPNNQTIICLPSRNGTMTGPKKQKIIMMKMNCLVYIAAWG
jgi:hypothetical protein